MLAFIKKFFFWILLAVLGVFALVLLSVFAWWNQFSVLNIMLVLSSITAIIAVFFAGRKIRIWLNKRKYINQMLTTTPVESVQPVHNENRMIQAFNKGLSVLKKSPENRITNNALYSQPWAIMLGKADTKSVIESLTASRISKENLTLPLRWHFLQELVVLDIDASLIDVHIPENTSLWEDFFIKLEEERKKEPINALILTIQAKDLYSDQSAFQENFPQSSELKMSHEQEIALRDYAHALRSRMEQIMSLLSAHLPIYVLVHGVDELYGMETLPARFSLAEQDELLGAVFTESQTEQQMRSSGVNKGAFFAQKAVIQVQNKIQNFLANESALGNFPRKNELYAVQVFAKMEYGLSIFLDNLLHTMPHRLNPIMRALAFTCKGHGENSAQFVQSAFLAKEQNGQNEQNITNNKSTSTLVTSTAPFLAPIASAHTTAHAFENTDSFDEVEAQKIIQEEISLPSYKDALPQAKQSAQASESLSVPCFIQELFSTLIPEDRHLYRLNVGRNTKKVWFLPAFTGYYLVLFVFCGILALNTIHNLQTFENIDNASHEYFMPIANHTQLKELQERYQRILYLEHAQKSWILPFLGINMIDKELEKEKQLFRRNMQTTALSNALIQTRNFANSQLALNSPHIFNESNTEPMNPNFVENAQNTEITESNVHNKKDVVPAISLKTSSLIELEKLLWMQKAIDERIENGKTKDIRDMPFPPSADKKDQVWNITFGELFLAYIDYSPVNSLTSLQKHISSDASTIFASFQSDIVAEMEYDINNRLLSDSISIDRFWSTIPAGSKYYATIPASYTLKGYGLIEKRMKDVLSLIGKGDFDLNELPAWKQYLAYYEKVWQDFSFQTNHTWNEITRASTLVNMANRSSIYDDPYIRLFQTMAQNLAPLEYAQASKWVEETFVLNALIDLSKLIGNQNPDSFLATPTLILKTLKNSPEHVRILQKKILDTHAPSYLVDLVSSFSKYFNALENISVTLKNSTASFELAKLQFGGANYGNIDESNFTIAKNALFSGLAFSDDLFNMSIGYDSENINPALYLIDGPYRFLSHALTIVAAKELQNRWSVSIVPAVATIPKDQLATVLFSDSGGLVTDFIRTEASPFLARFSGYYDAQSFDENYFPFTVDFLHFIQNGQEALYHQPKETYTIKLISQTGSLNSDAKEHLEYTELTMQCQDKTYTLRNSNYPENANFNYSPKICGSTALTFSFPSLQFKYSYKNFQDFLKDFTYGEKDFTASDFPQIQKQLEDLGIRRMTVRILPENAHDVLQVVDILSPLPARICGVW